VQLFQEAYTVVIKKMVHNSDYTVTLKHLLEIYLSSKPLLEMLPMMIEMPRGFTTDGSPAAGSAGEGMDREWDGTGKSFAQYAGGVVLGSFATLPPSPSPSPPSLAGSSTATNTRSTVTTTTTTVTPTPMLPLAPLAPLAPMAPTGSTVHSAVSGIYELPAIRDIAKVIILRGGDGRRGEGRRGEGRGGEGREDKLIRIEHSIKWVFWAPNKVHKQGVSIVLN
jgi:hypothetical protein